MSELNFIREESYKTPNMEYNEIDKTLMIEGRLIPEDPELFFNDIREWIKKWEDSGIPELKISMFLYYYNTSSLKRMSMLFEYLDELVVKGKKIEVLWKCDEADEDNIEDGQDFMEKYNFKFEIEVVPED
jgi:hypothetical protein